jgi:hypothetical protein
MISHLSDIRLYEMRPFSELLCYSIIAARADYDIVACLIKTTGQRYADAFVASGYNHRAIFRYFHIRSSVILSLR